MDTFIDLILRHLGTSAIMDLTCNLISGIEAPEYRQNALNVSPVGRGLLTGRRCLVMGRWFVDRGLVWWAWSGDGGVWYADGGMFW